MSSLQGSLESYYLTFTARTSPRWDYPRKRKMVPTYLFLGTFLGLLVGVTSECKYTVFLFDKICFD